MYAGRSRASSSPAIRPARRTAATRTSPTRAAPRSSPSSAQTGRITARTPVGGPARHVSISPNGRWLWVALGSSATHLVVLDLANRARPHARHTFAAPFPVHDVGYEPSGRRVWVTSGEHGNDEVLVYDGAARRILARLRAGAPPQHVSFGMSAAFVTSGDDGVLRVFSLAARPKLAHTTAVPRGSYNVQASGGTIVTPSLTEGTLCLLDDRGRVYLREQVARSSHDACLLPAASSGRARRSGATRTPWTSRPASARTRPSSSPCRPP